MTCYQVNVFDFIFISPPLSLVTSYGLDDPDFEFRQMKQQTVSLPAPHRTAVGPTQPPTGIRFFPGVKQPGHELDHPPPSSAKVKNEWSYTSTPTTCLHGMDKDNFFLQMRL